MRKILAAIAVSALIAGVALAQVPGLFLTTLTGNEQINVLVPSTGTVVTTPQIVSVKLAQIRDGSGYMAQQVPLTGFSLTVSNNVSMVTFKPAGTLSTGTITFPAIPFDGQRLQIFST